MQLIPNKLYLAMNAAMFIAYNATKDRPVPGSEIANYSNLNKRALEPILQKLTQAEIIASVKGAHGGYYMPRADKVTLCDIVRAFIEEVAPANKQFHGYEDAINDVVQAGYLSMLDALEQKNFQEICGNARKSGLIAHVSDSVLNYAI